MPETTEDSGGPAILAALHSENGKWDALRKATWCQIAVRIRDAAYADGRKITESEIEQRAHADPEYVAFLRRSIVEHAGHILDCEAQSGFIIVPPASAGR